MSGDQHQNATPDTTIYSVTENVLS